MDNCYHIYQEKVKKKYKEDVTLDYFDALCFHSPYCKLVQKSFARLAFVDFLKTPKDEASKKYPDLVKYHNVKLEDTYTNKDIEKAFVNLTKAKFAEKTQSSLFLANQVGNMYTPSVYSGLASLLINKPIKELAGTKVGVFSYGSGLCSSMYSITIAKQTEEGSI